MTSNTNVDKTKHVGGSYHALSSASRHKSSTSTFFVGSTTREYNSHNQNNIIFRDLDSWKWQQQHINTNDNRDNNLWTNVNVTQPLKYYEPSPDNIPKIIEVNKHEAEIFVPVHFLLRCRRPYLDGCGGIIPW